MMLSYKWVTLKIMMIVFVDLQMGNIWTMLPALQTPLSGSPPTKHQRNRAKLGTSEAKI